MLLILLLLFVVAPAERVQQQRGSPSPPARVCPSVARDDLLICLSTADTNEDGTLTVAEMDAWIAAHSECIPGSMLSGTIITTLCDKDASGNLTMTDWNDAASCITLRSRQMLLCQFCSKCGVYP